MLNGKRTKIKFPKLFEKVLRAAAGAVLYSFCAEAREDTLLLGSSSKEVLAEPGNLLLKARRK